MKWLDVYNRSFCQPKEMLVSINTEYPEEVEHIFVPSCVPLQRCAGCCTDEQLECVPTKTHIIIMEIMKTRYLSSEFVHLPFVQHSLYQRKIKEDLKGPRAVPVQRSAGSRTRRPASARAGRPHSAAKPGAWNSTNTRAGVKGRGDDTEELTSHPPDEEQFILLLNQSATLNQNGGTSLSAGLDHMIG
ncbi:vascular endothelial growth factor A isoform X1 [Latimeria chalumnae]|uniref:vascular endothelial growth factor A isoform X1 n=1 Tax=Latimeria chalumnae TaxID=7897 RepID=UPI0003C1042D|nr:PREDICTED: vascular endothelial growth factor B isoform X1 [Latimeria chalumnae]|eukprot:XP_005988899.1 PREDICTED: vascular endothelial growth factor B isoform X1 [Latimeria chalumnae]